MLYMSRVEEIPGCFMMLREQSVPPAPAHPRGPISSERSQGCVLSTMHSKGMSSCLATQTHWYDNSVFSEDVNKVFS